MQKSETLLISSRGFRSGVGGLPPSSSLPGRQELFSTYTNVASKLTEYGNLCLFSTWRHELQSLYKFACKQDRHLIEFHNKMQRSGKIKDSLDFLKRLSKWRRRSSTQFKPSRSVRALLNIYERGVQAHWVRQPLLFFQLLYAFYAIYVPLALGSVVITRSQFLHKYVKQWEKMVSWKAVSRTLCDRFITVTVSFPLTSDALTSFLFLLQDFQNWALRDCAIIIRRGGP